MSKFRARIRAAARRDILERLLDGKQPLRVTQCHALGHLSREADAAASCVAEARDLARYCEGREVAPQDVVRQVADNVLRGLPPWPTGHTAARAALTAIDAVEAGETGDAVAAASWAVAAASGEPLVGGDRHERLIRGALAVAVRAAAEGDHDDRFLAGAVVLTVAAVLRAVREATIAAPATSAVEAAE